ncbi:outer membrane autotransporter barrel domain-containing protein [Rhizobiales bacterium GAS113]|nr:outer membrane autotransporter barrel domain-containing protein [Rhizobiales bacterium GAS113]
MPTFARSLLSRVSFAALIAGTGVSAAQAQDATWVGGGAPVTNEWTQDNNWNPGTAPTGTATFDVSAVNSVLSSGLVSVNAVNFTAASSTYNISTNDIFLLNGTGIANANTGATQTFNVNSSMVFNNSSSASAGLGGVTYSVAGAMAFHGTSTAGTALINNSILVDFFDNSTAGNSTIFNNLNLGFNNSSTAGNANIINNLNGLVQFADSSTAGGANILNNSGAIQFLNTSSLGSAHIVNVAGSTTQFSNSSSAGSGSIVNNGTVSFNNTSTAASANIQNGNSLVFNDSSTAGNAIINNLGAGSTIDFFNTSSALGANITNNGTSFLDFHASSTAGNANITNNASGTIQLFDSSTAGNATISNALNATTQLFGTATLGNATITNGGNITFNGSSTAGNATITTNSVGDVVFSGTSSGGRASFITNAGGVFDMSLLTSAGMTAGSIAGAGNYFLGSKVLTVGGNNQSTSVSGVISDGGFGGGTGGSLIKTGTGTLTLSGLNTYSGGTFLNGGVLAVSSDANLGAASGGLSFDGGTLRAVGTLSSARSVTLNPGGGTLDAATGGITLSGNIIDGSGPGGLTIMSSGGGRQVLLSGNNSYSGATIVAPGGVLVAGSANAFSKNSDFTVNGNVALGGFNSTIKSLSGSGSVANVFGGPATLTIAPPSGTTTFSGGISDSPGNALTLAKAGAGTQVLTGANTYTGGTMLNAGTLGVGNSSALGTGPLTMQDGTTLQFVSSAMLSNAINFPGVDPTIDTGGNTAVLAGVISGTGGITKIGSGFLFLNGIDTYTGATTVSAGTLIVNGSIASSAVTVAGGAVLGGGGTVGALTVQGGATVTPSRAGGFVVPGGSPFATLNVSGNVTFAPGSTFLVGVNAAGQSDKLLAAGTATLQGGTVQVQAASGMYMPTTRYTLLTANGGVSGTFASLTTSTNLAFLTPTLSYDANDVFLGFTPTKTFPSVAITRNQATTAAAVQALGLGNPVYNVVLNQSVAGARQAFDALSGEVHASAVTAAFEDSRLPRDAILDRLSQHEAPTLGAATTMTGAYAADLPSGKHPNLAPVEVRMYQPHVFGVWGQGFGNWGTTGSDNNAAKLTRDTGGFIIGADTTLSTGWSGVWRLGVAGGYTDDSIKVSARSSSGDYQSIFGAVYGGTSYGAFDLKLGAIAASTDTHTSRSIVFPMFSGTASSSYGGYAVQGFAEAGYRLPFHWSIWSYVPGLESLSVTYEPFLQAAIVHIGQDRYAETAFAAGFGGAAGLVGAAHDYDLGSTTLGLRSEYALASLPGFTLRTLIGWRYAYGDVKPKVTQAFAGSLGSFTVAGVPIDRNALVTETNLDYAVSSAVTVGLSYAGQVGSKASDNAVKGHVDVSF